MGVSSSSVRVQSQHQAWEPKSGPSQEGLCLQDEKQIKTLDLFRLLLLEILYGNRKPEKQHYRKKLIPNLTLFVR